MTSYVSYAFTTLDDPNGIFGTEAYGINDAGQIVGTYYGFNASSHGFVLSNGVYTTVDVPGFSGTEVTAINNTGAIVGQCWHTGGSAYGFIYSGGSYTILSDPDLNNAGYTNVTGINDAGQVVGDWKDGNTNSHGFLYSNGTYTALNGPSNASAMHPGGINNAGEISGYYVDLTFGPQEGSHGFLDNGGNYVTLNEPLEYVPPPFNTFAHGINNAGQIGGTYIDSSNDWHGFLYDGSSKLHYH
jgi:probable HAF family extracellular repeat protein